MKKEVVLQCPLIFHVPPPGSQGPLELLFTILVSGFHTRLHFVPPRSLKEASVGPPRYIGSVLARPTAAKAPPLKGRKTPSSTAASAHIDPCTPPVNMSPPSFDPPAYVNSTSEHQIPYQKHADVPAFPRNLTSPLRKTQRTGLCVPIYLKMR